MSLNLRSTKWAAEFLRCRPVITDQESRAWVADPDRRYHCIFCGLHGDVNTFCVDASGHEVFGCPKCREYKGMSPCIPGKCEGGGSNE